MTEVKKTQKERVSEKYGAMVSYYAELLAECHNAVRKNSLLSKLDPMVKRLQQLHCLLERVQEWTSLMKQNRKQRNLWM